MDMGLETQLNNFRLPDCNCQLQHNQQIAKFCFQEGCGQLICPRCDMSHPHKDKMVLIYDLLESLLQKLSEPLEQQMSPDQYSLSQSNTSYNQQHDKLIEFIQEKTLWIEHYCMQIRSNLDKIKSNHHKDPIKPIIKDALLNLFQNQLCKDVIKQELEIIQKQIEIKDFAPLEFDMKKSKEQESVESNFNLYKTNFEFYLKTAETHVQKAAQLDLSKITEIQVFEDYENYCQATVPEQLNSATYQPVDFLANNPKNEKKMLAQVKQQYQAPQSGSYGLPSKSDSQQGPAQEQQADPNAVRLIMTPLFKDGKEVTLTVKKTTKFRELYAAARKIFGLTDTRVYGIQISLSKSGFQFAEDASTIESILPLIELSDYNLTVTKTGV